MSWVKRKGKGAAFIPAPAAPAPVPVASHAHIFTALDALATVALGRLLKIVIQVLRGIGAADVVPRLWHAARQGHEEPPLRPVLQQLAHCGVPGEGLDAVSLLMSAGAGGWVGKKERVQGVRKAWERGTHIHPAPHQGVQRANGFNILQHKLLCAHGVGGGPHWLAAIPLQGMQGSGAVGW